MGKKHQYNYDKSHKIKNEAMEQALLLLEWHSYGYKTGFEQGKKEAIQGRPSEKAKPPKAAGVALSTT